MWHNPTKWGAFSRSLGNGFTWRFYLTFTPQTQHQDGEVLHSQGLLAVTFTFFQAKSARSGADVVTNFHGEAYNSVFSPLLPHHTSMHTQWFSCVQLFVTPWTAACQAPLSKGFSTQGYWSGYPCPPPGDPPNPGIEPRSPSLQADSLPKTVYPYSTSSDLNLLCLLHWPVGSSSLRHLGSPFLPIRWC